MPQIPGRGVAADRIGGYVYGTIVVLATEIESEEAFRTGKGHVALAVLMTTVVFWLAHVYADAIAHSVQTGKRINRHDVLVIAHRESSIIEAALLPVSMLLLGKLGVFSLNTAVWLGVACGMGAMVLQGLRYARLERLSVLGTLAITGINLAIGFSLVGLKIFVGH